MADSPDFIPTVRVRDLIAAYENFSDAPEEIQQHRPRARSLGNILSKDVVVRSNEFRSLEDIETALTKVERDLNFYNVYSKEKHVSLQERLFNLLTSVVNIESSDGDGPVRRKRLVTKTQGLVSFLNQKLPANSTPTEDKKFTYTTYSSFVTSKNQNVDLRGTDSVDYVDDNLNQAKTSDHENRNRVSVQKLKHNYQPYAPENSATPIKPRSNILYSKSKSVIDQPSESKMNLNEESILEVEASEKIKSNGNMLPSVFRLKGLFEEKAREANKGLEIIIRNPKYPNLASHIPYIDSTLTNHRQHRLMSGSYTDYAHMLMNVDIKRSRSAYELNNNVEVKKSDKDDQDDSDDDTSSEESVQSVREVNLERANSVEKIPENIVQRTKLAYENSVYDSIQKDHTVYHADIERQNPDNKIDREENISLTTMSHVAQADPDDGDVFGEVTSSYVIEDPEEIPVNIVQRTKQAYENAAIESNQEDHRIHSNVLERRNSKPEIAVEEKLFVTSKFSNEDSPLGTPVNKYNFLEEEQASSYVIEDPEEIPDNIVQRTKEVYENAVLHYDQDSTLQSTSVDRPNSDSRKLVEKFYPTSAASNLNNDDILQEDDHISYAIEEPDDIPQNIVQRTRKVYEDAVSQDETDISNDNRRLHHATSFQDGSRGSCPTGQEENICFLTSEVTEEDAPEAIQLENKDMQEEEIQYLTAVTETEEIPENIVQQTVKLHVDADLDNRPKCPSFVEREILYCTAETGESQPRKKALNMANIKENILYAPPKMSEVGVPQAVHLDNEDMKEEIDIKYSCAITDSEEIPTNIVQRTVEVYENSVLEQEAVIVEQEELRTIDRDESTAQDQFDGPGEHGKVETFIEEEVKYSSVLLESGQHPIILGQTMEVSEGQETNVDVQGFIEEDVAYSSPVVNLDGIPRSMQNSKDNGVKPKLLLDSGVNNEDALKREHPGYKNGEANDLSLDEEEDLKRAEEEFEKLLEQS